MGKDKKTLIVKGTKFKFETRVDFKYAIVITQYHPKERMELWKANDVHPNHIKSSSGKTEVSFHPSKTYNNAVKRLKSLCTLVRDFETVDDCMQKGWLTWEVKELIEKNN